MKAFLQYLVYLCTGKTVQQQMAAKVRPIIEEDDILLDPDYLEKGIALKRSLALDYLGDKWLLHPANYVQRKSALSALPCSAQKA